MSDELDDELPDDDPHKGREPDDTDEAEAILREALNDG